MTTLFTMRMHEDTRKALEEMASDEGRSLAGMVKRLVEEEKTRRTNPVARLPRYILNPAHFGIQNTAGVAVEDLGTGPGDEV